MPFQKRCCSECLHFKAAPMGGTGWCEHPKIKLSDGVKLLVRGSELRCRNNWDHDLWESNAGVPPVPVALDPSVRTQPAGEFPLDDQVTAVSPAGLLQNSAPEAQSIEASRRLDPNTAANDDQHERVRAMHRGPGDALREARQRSLKRRQDDERRARQLVPPIVDQDGTAAETDAASRPGVSAVPTDGDLLQSIAPDRPLPGSPAITEELPSVSDGDADAPHLASLDRFDQIPEIRADVDISQMRRFFGSEIQDESAPVDAGFQADVPDDRRSRMSTYDDVMRQARAIRERNRTAPQRRAFTAPSIAEYAPEPPDETPADPGIAPPITWDIGRDELTASFHTHAGSPATEYDQAATFDVIADEDPPGYEEEFISSPEPRRKSWFGGLRRGNRQMFADPDQELSFSEREDREWSAESPYANDQGGGALDWDDSGEPVDAYAGPDDDDDRILDDRDLRNRDTNEPVEIERSLSDDEFGWRPDTDEILDSSYNDTQSSDRVISDGFREEFLEDDERPDMHRAADVPVARELSGRPLTTFDLSDPDGMSAFRQALFNDQEPQAAAQPIQVESFRRRPRRAARDHVEPYSFDVAARTADALRAEPASRPSAPVEVAQPRHEPTLSPRTIERPGSHSTNRLAFDIRDVVRDVDEPTEIYAELAPHLPRSCSTCRDFWPDESGDQGWCTNAWAFDHRQMVNADDLPCRSSIGHWWLPVDAAWLPALDTRAHDEPAPLFDALIAWINDRDEIGRRRRREQSEEQLYVREI